MTGSRLLLACLLGSSLASPSILVADELRSCAEALPIRLRDSLPCKLAIVSSVSVRFQGDLLTDRQADLERLLRLRLRNDLSMLRHEEKSVDDLTKEFIFGVDREKRELELKKRGTVSCFVWTVGTSYPIAFLVECKLAGYSTYSSPLYSEFSSRVLGIAGKDALYGQVDTALRQIIAIIASDFLSARDKLTAGSR